MPTTAEAAAGDQEKHSEGKYLWRPWQSDSAGKNDCRYEKIVASNLGERAQCPGSRGTSETKVKRNKI